MGEPLLSRLAQGAANIGETVRYCRYGNCIDWYDTRGRIDSGLGPANCPYELRGGVRGHGTWAEQYAPAPARKPSLRRRGWRRARR